MIIQPPEKMRNYYLSQITTSGNRNVVLKLEGICIIDIGVLADDVGYTMHVWVPKDCPAYEKIVELETIAFESVIKHRKDWFKTELPQEKISEYFRTCIGANNIVPIIVSNLKPPGIVMQDADISDFSQLQSYNIRKLRKMHCECKVEVSGLYFYPKKFGIRLTLRSITLKNANANGADNDISFESYREDIEHDWAVEVKEACSLLQADEDMLLKKIEKLHSIKQQMYGLLSTAKSQDNCTKKWNQDLEDLRQLIFKYKIGRLS